MIKNSPKIYKTTSDFDFSVNRFLDEGLRSILVVFLKIKDPETEGTLKVRKFKIKKYKSGPHVKSAFAVLQWTWSTD